MPAAFTDLQLAAALRRERDRHAALVAELWSALGDSAVPGLTLAENIRTLRDEVARLSETECARAVDALRAEIAWRMEIDSRAAAGEVHHG